MVAIDAIGSIDATLLPIDAIVPIVPIVPIIPIDTIGSIDR